MNEKIKPVKVKKSPRWEEIEKAGLYGSMRTDIRPFCPTCNEELQNATPKCPECGQEIMWGLK